MNSIFYLASSLNSSAFNSDLSKWNVSKVTTMWGMFYGARSFDSDLSKWDVANVTNMGSMFRYARSFNADLSKWDVSKVTSMWYMFDTARSFNSDLSKWDVVKVTNMKGMFKYASSFNQTLCGEAWVNSKAKADQSDMFVGSISTTVCGVWAIDIILFLCFKLRTTTLSHVVS